MQRYSDIFCLNFTVFVITIFIVRNCYSNTVFIWAAPLIARFLQCCSICLLCIALNTIGILMHPYYYTILFSPYFATFEIILYFSVIYIYLYTHGSQAFLQASWHYSLCSCGYGERKIKKMVSFKYRPDLFHQQNKLPLNIIHILLVLSRNRSDFLANTVYWITQFLSFWSCAISNRWILYLSQKTQI